VVAGSLYWDKSNLKGPNLTDRLNDEPGELEAEQRLERTLLPNADETNSPGLAAGIVHSPGEILLDKLKVIELLGQGGMGSVYRVEHLLMNRQFALKCLNKFQANDASWRRFQNEAKAAHLLDHPNLLKVFDFGLLPGGQPYFLMELVEGITLSDEIKRLGSLPVARAVKIFIQVSFAIGYAHEHKVIHRDLKPSNIMLVKKSETDAEIVKVVDFGIAKLTGVDEFNQQTLTKTGEIFGSPLYMSPEQCMGIAVDHRSDLYSLGCVFYEALCSAPPFMGESALSTMMKHQTEMQLSLKEASLGMEYPTGLEEIIMNLLEKDPQNRYQTANQLVADLIQVERSLGIAEDQAESAPTSGATTKPLKREAELVRRTARPHNRKKHILITTAIATGTFMLGIAVSSIVQQNTQAKPQEEPVSIKNLQNETDPSYDLAVAKQKEWSTLMFDKRIFHFPSKQSLGKIALGNGEVFEAQGKVTVLRALPVGLLANEYLLQHPELMDKFRPGEISLFDFNASRTAGPQFFSKISATTGMKALNLYDTEFTDRDAPLLTKMTDLVYLNVGYTGLTGPQILKYAPLAGLNCLDITGDKDARKIIPKVPTLPHLRHAILVHISLKDEDMEILARAKQLKILDVAWNRSISDKGVEKLTQLKNLEYLSLAETGVSPGVWKSLVKMPNLRKVKLARFRDKTWPYVIRQQFEALLAKHAPQIKVNWNYDDHLDFSIASTDFAWSGPGTQAHKSPILSAINDVGMGMPSNAEKQEDKQEEK
jgi:serine/threonine protein kinase